jgi:hypothetical protein
MRIGLLPNMARLIEVLDESSHRGVKGCAGWLMGYQASGFDN